MPPKGTKPYNVDKLRVLFAKEYVANMGNGTKAYLSVYPNAKIGTAATQASRMLNDPKIKALIENEYKRVFKDKDDEIERSKTYKMIHSIGNTNIAEVIDLEGGTLRVKDLSEIPESAQHAIESVKRRYKETKYGPEEYLEVKLFDKIKALELRAKLQGMLQDKTELTGEIIVKKAVRPDKKDE